MGGDGDYPQAPCSICLAPLAATRCTTTACDHVFHAACLRAWRNASSEARDTCPLCRAPLQTQRALERAIAALRAEAEQLLVLTTRLVCHASQAEMRIDAARTAMRLYLHIHGPPLAGVGLSFKRVERAAVHESADTTRVLVQLLPQSVRLQQRILQRFHEASATRGALDECLRALANLRDMQERLIQFTQSLGDPVDPYSAYQS